MKLLLVGGKNESGQAINFALNNLGELKIQHEWKTEEILVLNQVPITTTNEAWSDRVQIGKYAMYSIRIFNTLNQPVSITFCKDTGENTTIQLKNYAGSNFGFTIPASSGYRMITPEEFPFLQYLANFRIKYVCATAPTQGTLTFEIVGKY